MQRRPASPIARCSGAGAASASCPRAPSSRFSALRTAATAAMRSPFSISTLGSAP